jgi:hypothetical protein
VRIIQVFFLTQAVSTDTFRKDWEPPKELGVDGVPKWLIALAECVLIIERKVFVEKYRLVVSSPPLRRHLVGRGWGGQRGCVSDGATKLEVVVHGGSYSRAKFRSTSRLSKCIISILPPLIAMRGYYRLYSRK